MSATHSLRSGRERGHRRGWRGRLSAGRGWLRWRWSSSPRQAWSCTVRTYTGRRWQTASLQNTKNDLRETAQQVTSMHDAPLQLRLVIEHGDITLTIASSFIQSMTNTLNQPHRKVTYSCESSSLSLRLLEFPVQLCNTKVMRMRKTFCARW